MTAESIKPDICRMNFAVAITVMPILFIYSGGIATLTLGDMYLAVSFIWLVIHCKSLRISENLVALILYIIIRTLICLFFDSTFTTKHALATARYLSYLFYAMIIPTVGNRVFVKRIVYIVTMVASLFLIIQYVVLSITGEYISGAISFLPLSDQSVGEYGKEISSNGTLRCMSFFAEPAHFATYVIPVCIMKLFESRDKINLSALIITISVVLCGSLTGIYILAVLWVIWIILLKQPNVIVKIFSIIGIIAILGIVLYILKLSGAGIFDITENTVDRKTEGRMSGFSYVAEFLRGNPLGMLFGVGLKSVALIIYLSGIPRVIYYFGIIGIIIYTIVLSKYYKESNIAGKMIVISIVGLSIGTEMIVGNMFMYYILTIYVCSNLIVADNR